MFKKFCNSAALLSLLVAVPAMADESVMSKYKVSLGGYVKLDYAHNTNASGPSSLPGGGAAADSANIKSESIFTAKQSRLWLKVAGPDAFGAKTNAMIEVDFYGNSSLSNEFANMRMRHAYGSLDWTNTQVLFGQFWDIFGPAGADTIDFRQGGDTGAPNSPRVPQLRLTQKLNLNSDNSIKFVLGLQNPVQDSASSQANAFPSVTATGAYGDMVNVAGQIMYSSKALGVSPGFMGMGNKPFEIGLFGLYGNQKIAGQKQIDCWGYGIYGFVPLMKSSDGKSRAMTLSFETQADMAAGLNVQNATSIAFVGTAPNRTAAKGYNLYAQLKFFPTQSLGLTAGYTRRGAIDYAAYQAATTAATSYQQYTELNYVNATYDLNAAVRVATEFEQVVTRYGASPTTPAGASNRGQNNIARLAVYYFF